MVRIMERKLLAAIHSPEDLRRMSGKELTELCKEIRDEIIETVAENGGHLAPNLGVIELTVALHKVFPSPDDTIIWDVGHQSYPHKLLTGRYENFKTIRKYGGLSGFQNPAESPYDKFVTGHAGTALSSAMGLAEAYAKTGVKHKVVAVVGDGSLGNGISLEALNNVKALKGNFILIINDNKMSISKSVGAISTHLSQVITARAYNRFKTRTKLFLKHLPFGHSVIRIIGRLEAITKNLFVSSVLFEEAGFKYVGPLDGHNLPLLISHLEKIRELNVRPVALHVVTEKGHGCSYAISSPEKFHGVPAFDPQSGKLKSSSGKTKSFSAGFGESIIKLAEKHREVCAITAAMAGGTGLKEFSEKFPDRFYDVGIAEEHAVVFAGGLAAGGLRPVFAVYSTFLQRGLDCVFHDICLCGRPVIFCVDRAGAVEDGPTHHGIYDLPFLLNMPNLSIMAPRDVTELHDMLFAAFDRKAPVMLRYPRSDGSDLEVPRFPLKWGCAEEVQSGTDVAIWASGRELSSALAVAAILRRENCSASVVNARFLKPFDSEKMLADSQTKFIVTIEDAMNAGGLGILTDRLLVQRKIRGILHFSWNGEMPPPHGSLIELRKSAGMLPEQIAKRILAEMK